MKNREYFKKIEREYQEATAYNDELYQNIAAELDKILWGKVIDFGNGGIINYKTEHLEKLICVDIINEARELSQNKIDFIYGDFYDIELQCQANCVLSQLMLHHLVDDVKVKKSLGKLSSILAEDGKFIIVEVEFPWILEMLQNIFKPLIFRALAMINKPSLRFFSHRSLIKLLTEAGFGHIRTQRIPIGARISPASVLFPRLKISGWLYPFKCVLMEAQIVDMAKKNL